MRRRRGMGPLRRRLGARLAAAVVDPPAAPPAGTPAAVAVVVPAATRRPRCPRLLGAARRPTARRRRAGRRRRPLVRRHGRRRRVAGARVVAAPPLPAGWVGKPHACATGAAATTAPAARVPRRRRAPGPGLLDGLAAGRRPRPTPSSRCSRGTTPSRPASGSTLLANVVAADGQRGVHGARRRASLTDVAFGPVLAVRRADLRRASAATASATVRASLTEDIALARAVGRSRLFTRPARRDVPHVPRRASASRSPGGRARWPPAWRRRAGGCAGRRGVGCVARRRAVRRLARLPAERHAGVGARAAGRARRAAARRGLPGARGGARRHRRAGRLAAAPGHDDVEGAAAVRAA